MTYSEEELIEELQRVSEEYCGGKAPRYDRMNEINNTPSSSTYERHFGSWGEALREADFETNQEKNISKERLEEELKRISKKYCSGRKPTIDDLRKFSKYSYKPYVRVWGSWGNAINSDEFNFDKRIQIPDMELLGELKRLQKELSRIPRACDMKEHGFFAVSTYLRRFDSWSNAIGEVFDIETKDGFVSHDGLDEGYTEEDLIGELKRVSEEYNNGRSPTKKDMSEYGSIGASTYYRRFGSWNNALKDAGFSINKKVKCTKEELIEDLKTVSEIENNSSSLTRTEYGQFGEFSYTTIERYFGSWNNALREADFKPNQEKRISEKELIKEMKRVSEEHCDGFTPRTKDMNKHGIYSSRPYCSKFNSWSEAVIEAGFEENIRYDFLPSGEEHPQWKGGASFEDYGLNWDYQKTKCLERDDKKCAVCDSKPSQDWFNNPDVHHITPARYWNSDKEHEKMNHLRNLICLCRSCHHKLEGKFKGRNHKEFEELAKDYLDIEEVEEKKGIFDY